MTRARIRSAGGLAAIVLLLPACSVGPEYQRPEVVLPETFRFAVDGDVDALDVAWWSGFDDPVLDRLVAEALAENRDVRVAAARVEEFAARIGVSRSAAFPQVGYGGEAGRSRLSREIAPGSAGGDRTSDFFTANLNVGWELDLWGRIRRATDAARADTLAAEEVRRGVVLSLVTNVATSYVALRSLDAQLAVARDKLATRADTVALFELQFESGVISQLELAQIRSEFERTATAIPGIERDIARLENSLSVLLGRAPGAIERGRTISELAMPAIPAGLPAEMLRRRPDLRGAELAMMAANERIGVAMADFYPRVSLSGALGLASDDLSQLVGSSAGFGEIAAGIAGPIFTGGLLEARLDAAEAVERQTIEAFRQSWLTALRESEDALVTRSTTLDEVASQGRQIEALAAYAGLARMRYDNGYVGYLEVLDAERTLFDAELAQIQLRASLYASVIGIYKAFGGGWITVAERVADEAAQADAAAAGASPAAADVAASGD
jgi:multidrug efflux system outer membrane protein